MVLADDDGCTRVSLVAFEGGAEVTLRDNSGEVAVAVHHQDAHDGAGLPTQYDDAVSPRR